MATLLLLALLSQDRIERKCDAAKTEIADWCRTCDRPAGKDAHDGHDVTKATLCVRSTWTDG